MKASSSVIVAPSSSLPFLKAEVLTNSVMVSGPPTLFFRNRNFSEENPPEKAKFEVENAGIEMGLRDLWGLGEKGKGERCKRVVAPDIVWSKLETNRSHFAVFNSASNNSAQHVGWLRKVQVRHPLHNPILRLSHQPYSSPSFNEKKPNYQFCYLPNFASPSSRKVFTNIKKIK